MYPVSKTQSKANLKNKLNDQLYESNKTEIKKDLIISNQIIH